LLITSLVYCMDHIIEILRAWNEESLEFRLATGYFDDAVYVFVRVMDDSVVYREPNSISVHRNDNLQIVTVGGDDDIHRYTIATIQPGDATAFVVAPRDQGARALGTEPRVQAYWLATERGFNLEVRIPRDLVAANAGFAVSDVDDQATRTLIATIGTANLFDPEALGSLLVPSPAIESRLEQVG
ncbi:MAG: proteobacterial dedicated sortase system histidine kinase, partial [Pseudomonadales bacterium]|nr:proteobacterial dedicated sortase system histidine kinase [Pseudomonadales bacterium]